MKLFSPLVNEGAKIYISFLSKSLRLIATSSRVFPTNRVPVRFHRLIKLDVSLLSLLTGILVKSPGCPRRIWKSKGILYPSLLYGGQYNIFPSDRHSKSHTREIKRSIVRERTVRRMRTDREIAGEGEGEERSRLARNSCNLMGFFDWYLMPVPIGPIHTPLTYPERYL